MIYGLLRIINSKNPLELLDDIFFNKKINCFDTANCYGRSENIFGEWITTRNINRNDFYIICKGGHHSHKDTKLINRINTNDIIYDLKQSFERLKITYADTFIFHRDDENVSPEDIYNICINLLDSNMCKKIGVSNWKTSRIEEVNQISKNIKQISIIQESQIFLNYIKLSYIPYENIHMINYLDYLWYKNNPEHKIQIYSVACFINELNNKIHQNNIFNKILEYICNITNESKQTMLYVLLSNCKELNVECIHGSITSHHILTENRINELYLLIKNKIPNIIEILPCFIVERPIERPQNNLSSFIINGFVGPFPLENINSDSIDSIVTYVLNKNFNNYDQMKHHHEHNNDIYELCSNNILNDIVTKYIGYECICYNTEFFLRQNNDTFTYTKNWHIDPYLNIDNKYPHFTLQIGLTDNTDNNSLAVILGSHIFDYQNKYKEINKTNNFAPLVNFDDTKIDNNIKYNLLNKKGFVYLFSNYLTHGKGLIVNTDNTDVRLAITLRIISKESIITNITNNSHISKNIYKLGANTDLPESIESNVIWTIVQNIFKTEYFV
jgi:predicted oxidoreductase